MEKWSQQGGWWRKAIFAVVALGHVISDVAEDLLLTTLLGGFLVLWAIDHQAQVGLAGFFVLLGMAGLFLLPYPIIVSGIILSFFAEIRGKSWDSARREKHEKLFEDVCAPLGIGSLFVWVAILIFVLLCAIK